MVGGCGGHCIHSLYSLVYSAVLYSIEQARCALSVLSAHCKLCSGLVIKINCDVMDAFAIYMMLRCAVSVLS